MIIDVHTHYRSKALLEESIKRGQIKIVVDAEGKKHAHDADMSYMFTMTEDYGEPDLEKRIRYLDQHGIDMQVLSTPRSSEYSAEDGPDLVRISNDGIAEVVRKYPKRFLGLASVPLKNRAKSADEVDRAIHELGLRGICISGIKGVPLDSDYYWPLYKKVTELDIPIFVHPGIPAGADQMKDYGLVPIVGFEFDLILTQARLIYGGVLEEFPALKFIFSHLGGGIPFLKERIENGWGFAKVVPGKKATIPKPPSYYLEKFYFETVSFYKPAIMCTIQCSGVDKMLFGTDYPLYPLGDIPSSMRVIRELDLCQSDREKILGENAKRLFKIA